MHGRKDLTHRHATGPSLVIYEPLTTLDPTPDSCPRTEPSFLAVLDNQARKAPRYPDRPRYAHA